MPRLPQDPENWTGIHAERCIARAWRLFEFYERKVDFEKMSETEVNDLYAPYMHARDEAIGVARTTQWKVKEAEALP
jgi:hypothetical protein